MTDGRACNTLEVFDPATNTWNTPVTTGIPTRRYEHTANIINGKIYLIGGYNGSYPDNVDAFDPSTNTWSTSATSGTFTPRMSLTSSVVNDKIYVLGGMVAVTGLNILNANEIFTPANADVKTNDAVTTNIELSPNPTNGSLTLYNLPASAQVRIENILGETVMELGNIETSDVTLDLSKLPAGTYFARIVTANSVVTKKIVRE